MMARFLLAMICWAAGAAQAAVATKLSDGRTVLFSVDDAGVMTRATCAPGVPLHDQGTCNFGFRRTSAAPVVAAVRDDIDDTASWESEIALHGAKALRLDQMIYEQVVAQAGGAADATRKQLDANLAAQAKSLDDAASLKDQLARLDAALARAVDPELSAQRAITAAALGDVAGKLRALQTEAASLTAALAAGDDQSLIFRGLVAQRRTEAEAVAAAQQQLTQRLAAVAKLELFLKMLLDPHATIDILPDDGGFPQLLVFPPLLAGELDRIYQREHLAEIKRLQDEVEALTRKLDALIVDGDVAVASGLRWDVEHQVYSSYSVTFHLQASAPDCRGGTFSRTMFQIYWHGASGGDWQAAVGAMAVDLDAGLGAGWRQWRPGTNDCGAGIDGGGRLEASLRQAIVQATAVEEADATLCAEKAPAEGVELVTGDLELLDCQTLPARASRLRVYTGKGGAAWLSGYVAANAARLEGVERARLAREAKRNELYEVQMNGN